MIATNNDDLAEGCRIGRDYGNPGDYNCRFIGLSARMSEIHAVMALASIKDLEERLQQRRALADAYRRGLEDCPGIRFPDVGPGDRATYKDLAIIVAPDEFGVSAADLQIALRLEGIDTRRYYWPPVHRMHAYRHATKDVDLSVTDEISPRVLALPLFDELQVADVDRVVDAILRIHRFSDELVDTLQGSKDGG